MVILVSSCGPVVAHHDPRSCCAPVVVTGRHHAIWREMKPGRIRSAIARPRTAAADKTRAGCATGRAAGKIAHFGRDVSVEVELVLVRGTINPTEGVMVIRRGRG